MVINVKKTTHLLGVICGVVGVTLNDDDTDDDGGGVVERPVVGITVVVSPFPLSGTENKQK